MTREMKDSGIEWLGKIPKDWRTSKIKYVSQYLYSGGTPTASNNLFYSNKGVNFINISDMTNNKYIYSSKKKVTEKGIENKNLKILPPETILYSMYATLGKVAITKVPATISQAILAIKPDESIIDKSYLIYFLKVLEKNIEFYSNGTTQRNLSKGKIKNFNVLVPPIKKQKRIVKYLHQVVSQINQLILLTENSITELKSYKQSLITEKVTKGLDPDVPMKDSGVECIGEIPEDWETVKIKYLFNFSRGLNITKSKFVKNGINVVTYGDIHSRYGFRVNPSEHKLNSVAYSYLGKKPEAILNRGDFIFADTSEDIEGSGNFTCYDSDDLCMAGYHTVVLKPKEEINYKYLAYLFDSSNFRRQIQHMVSGVKVYSINQNILKNVFALLPSKKEQKEIADYLYKRTAQIDNIIEDKTKLIEELQTYKQSLIYEYVTGKKEVR